MVEIQHVHTDNDSAYGASKIWYHLNRQDSDLAGCTVKRLMRRLNRTGQVGGRPAARPCPTPQRNRLRIW